MATGVELATAWVRLVPSLDGVQGAIAKELNPAADKAGEDAGKRAGGKFTTGMKVAVTAASAAIVAGVVKVFNTGLEELKFGEEINAQTEQLLKNTGIESSVERINKYTLALSKVSGISEEELQAAGNSVLKFGNVSADQLQRATHSINNLGAAGKDVAGVGEMLGKALADPTKAATLLRRAGIQLTEQQKEQITAFTEAGDLASAQNVILTSLEDTYGGMAEAAGNTLTGKLNKLNNAWENMAGSMVEMVLPAVSWIADAIAGLMDFMESNPGVVQALAIALGVLTVAIVAANVAMWAMSMNPIVLLIMAIVVAVGALVAAIVWVATQTTFFQDVWSAAMKIVGDVASWLWEKILQPVFKAIGDIVTWVWTKIIKPVVDLVVNAFRFWGAVGAWLYTNAIKPAIDGIATAFNWVWTFIIKPLIDLIVNYFRLWGAIAAWLYENAIKPVFDSIAAVFQWIWNSIIKPVIDWIREKLDILGLGFRILYEKFVKPAFEAVGDTLDTVWRWINDHVFTPFKYGIDLVGQAFANVAEAIRISWDGIKRAAAVPINFVLDTVWNNGLRSFWNDMVGNLGLNDMKLPAAPLIRFAQGGVLPGYTPGRDVHQFYSPTGGRLALSGGEGIMRPEFVRAVGGAAGIARLNAMARKGQAFKDGGVFGSAGSFAGDVWDNIAGAAGVAWEFLSNPGTAIQKHVIDGIIRPLLGGAGNSVFAKLAGQLPIKLVQGMVGKFEKAGAAGRGTKGMGWKAMWDVVRQAVPGAVKTSDFRPGAKTVNGGQSYHALGRAIDVVPASMNTFNALARLFPNASELIYTPAGSRQLLNGKPFAGWSAAVKAQHYNHVHLAMRNGGVLPGLMNGGTVTKPGYTVVGEQGPELLKLPAGAQVNPDYDEVPSGRGFTFINQAPLGSTPSQELEKFANQTEAFLP
ncbi:tape measure protein [Microbacterium phage Lynlen]|uniref:tape measure protein n=1 Tax=Microbacterium phage Lynlen TaxID=2725651 RepID=UPI001462CA39|nr:tape measure protein [Microbacterium phage Lynlen]YP_010753512.1 tape measure protein [Microbacterium phage Kenzers]QJD53425.1 tape measure protein [Microbacterium phage Lynlen]UVT31645.1 tape measure protein [Microbacterium phage Kenzers]